MNPSLPSSFANRGAKAEKAVQKFLETWAENRFTREYSRLTDSKAAGRTIKAADADFAFYCRDSAQLVYHGLIEVKETRHDTRLARDKLTQFPRLRKRTACGGFCVVLVHHSDSGLWRYAKVEDLEVTGDKGAWNLAEGNVYASPGEALAAFLPQVFGHSQ